MEKTLVAQIMNCVERTFDIDGIDYSKKIIIFPLGDVGCQVANILKTVYDIEPAFVLDNKKSRYNPKIQEIEFLKTIDCNEYVVILASTNSDIYPELKRMLCSFFPSEQILELGCMIKCDDEEEKKPIFFTQIGKYSYGPICCNHELIKSIGAFCSFSTGVEVVPNHEMNYLTTHPMIYFGRTYEDVYINYDDYKDAPWYVPGVKPKGNIKKRNRITIGNDVWLGRNVIITNGANIGNGVIAGAGTVITKDIPDYAVVVGAPARVIRYRYTPEQISALNQIAWWNWSDDEIRERYDDFYLPVEEFIEKYTTKPSAD